MLAFLGITNKKKNSTYQPSLQQSFEILLKEPTSAVNPVIQIRSDGSTNFGIYNYAYIPKFQRRYFVVDAVSLNAHMWELSLNVDVLATYREQILATKAFVRAAQSKANSMIPDSRLPITDSSELTIQSQPWGVYSEAGSFILSVASQNSNGRNGMAQVYALTAGDIAALAQSMLSKSLFEQLKELYTNPENLVINCMWIPVGLLFSGSGTSAVKIGDFDTGVSGMIAQDVIEQVQNFTIELPYKYELPDGSMTYADYRNVEPYTKYTIKLPGIGLVELPMITLIGDGSALPVVEVKYTISPATGDITYQLSKDHNPFLFLNGKLGMQVPVTNTQSGIGQALQSVIGTITSAGVTIVSLVNGNALGMIGGVAALGHNAMGAVQQAQQQTHTVAGSLGGRSGARYCENIEVVVNPFKVSDSPSAVGDVIGRPYYHHGTLGDFSGFVNCTGAYVQCEATEQEHELLNIFLNNFATNSYGGIFIE